MAEIKVVLSNPKTGKSYQKILKDADARKLFGLKIGDTIKGELLDLSGYEFQITGGSDYAGFPMRVDISGVARKKIWAVRGIGIRKLKKRKGTRQRKTVAGNTIYEKTAQVNLKVIKEGKGPLGEEKKKEETKEEAPAEVKKEENK